MCGSEVSHSGCSAEHARKPQHLTGFHVGGDAVLAGFGTVLGILFQAVLKAVTGFGMLPGPSAEGSISFCSLVVSSVIGWHLCGSDGGGSLGFGGQCWSFLTPAFVDEMSVLLLSCKLLQNASQHFIHGHKACSSSNLIGDLFILTG